MIHAIPWCPNFPFHLRKPYSKEALGCFLSAAADGKPTVAVTYDFQAAKRALFANKQHLCDKRVRLQLRLRCFDWGITTVILFVSGRRVELS